MDRDANQSYLSYLKNLCTNRFAVNVTLTGTSPGALFKLSNLSKLGIGDADDKRIWWSKLRQLKCDTHESSTLNGNSEHDRGNIDPSTLPPSPPPEYSNFTVLDSNISCH